MSIICKIMISHERFCGKRNLKTYSFFFFFFFFFIKVNLLSLFPLYTHFKHIRTVQSLLVHFLTEVKSQKQQVVEHQ